LVLTGQSADLAPADGKMYALRDVTGTVQSIPLIASSVMCKKIAAGAQAIVLDVKVGLGAFMTNLEEARVLSELMVSIAHLAGRKAVALLSDMNQPLGWAVGNALEVKEAIQILHGGGPPDFREHCLVVAGHMLTLGGVARDAEHGRKLAQQALEDGRGWQKFRALVSIQGGDVDTIDHPERLPAAALVETVPAPRSGYLHGIHAQIIGEAAVQLGAGRSRKEDPIDHAVGILVHHKVGDYLEEGEPLFTIHANQPAALEVARGELLAAHSWSDDPVPPLPLFYGEVEGPQS
jgi:pyrimidine-nucleoside phosphorylase